MNVSPTHVKMQQHVSMKLIRTRVSVSLALMELTVVSKAKKKHMRFMVYVVVCLVRNM